MSYPLPCVGIFAISLFISAQTALTNTQTLPKMPSSTNQVENQPSQDHSDTTSQLPSQMPNRTVVQSVYGKTADGQTVLKFDCTNGRGNSMSMLSYGATMSSLNMPDRNGKRANIILTCPDMAGWQACTSYFGCSIGRFCNRIKEGKFTIDGQSYSLAANNSPNHLHGGNQGFDKLVWDAKPVTTADAVGVQFNYRSKDGEEGYPGNLDVQVTYLLNDQDELSFEFRATTDKITPVNLTNHNYWNLAGHDSGNHLEQTLMIQADQYLVADDTLIPTGQLKDVTGTEFDFLSFRKIGERVQAAGLSQTKGYDLCYAIRDADGQLRLAATAKDPTSGRVMEVHTDQPGLQFYTGNWLDGQAASGGYDQYSGFCLETQHYPDSPNQESFPNTLLSPGDEYVHRTVLKFRTE